MPTPEQKVCPECGGLGEALYTPKLNMPTGPDGIEGGYHSCPTCKGTGRDLGPLPSADDVRGILKPDPEDQGGQRKTLKADNTDRPDFIPPEVCPTCGSDDPAHHPPRLNEYDEPECPDDFHTGLEDQGGEGEAEGSGLRSASSGSPPDWLLDARDDLTEKVARYGATWSEQEPATFDRGYFGGYSDACRHALKALPPFLVDPDPEDWREEGFTPPGSTPAEASGVGAEPEATLRERVERVRDDMRDAEAEWKKATVGVETHPRAWAYGDAADQLDLILDSTESPSPTPEEGLREALEEIAAGCGWMYDDDPEYEPEPEDWWRVVRDLRARARTALGDGGRDE